jgi:hypothetical protein
MVGNDDQLPEVIAARVAERRESEESAAEVFAWLVDLGYRVSPAEFEAVASRHRQRRAGDTRAERGGPR